MRTFASASTLCLGIQYVQRPGSLCIPHLIAWVRASSPYGCLSVGSQVPLDSRFQRSDAHTDGAATPTAVVPAGTAWLLGDNELNSIDSRHYGPVPISLITSRVIFRVHPQDEAGPIEQRLPDELAAARLHEHWG